MLSSWKDTHLKMHVAFTIDNFQQVSNKFRSNYCSIKVSKNGENIHPNDVLDVDVVN